MVVCDPDILSFNIRDHRMHFAILASDGLWDTHTNEEAVSVIGDRWDTQIHSNVYPLSSTSRIPGDGDLGAEVLAREAFTRGSLDNITVLVVNFRKVFNN